MPQMAPLYWLVLLIAFTLALLTFNTLNFFSNNKTPISTEYSEKKMSAKSWKW